MAEVSLFVDQLLGNPDKFADHRVQINGGGISAVGFLNSAFNLNISPTWEMNDGGVFTTGNKAMAELGIDAALTSYMSTVAHWQATPRPSYPIDFTVVSYKPSIDVRTVYRDLMKAVLPVPESGWMVTPPAGYKVSRLETQGNAKYIPQGTLDLRIGNWFYQRGLIMTSLSGTFSREVVPNGSPLYLEVNLSLTPYRMVDLADMDAALQGGSGGSAGLSDPNSSVGT